MVSMRRWLAIVLAGAVLSAQAADPAKVLRVAFEQDVTGIDPQAITDSYSAWICRGIFDSLLQYDYVERPYALKPSAAESLPEIHDGGRTMLVRIKRGIYFTPDPAFKGKPRELVAEDYVYSWKRLIDPRMRSFWSFYLDGKLLGADEVVATARRTGRFDYDARIEGLRALDRYTLQIKLKEPDYLLIERMTSVPMAAVAREVVEAYGAPDTGWTMAHPVGTGPFTLAEWRRASKLVLRANRDYREERYPAVAASEPSTARANAGKRLPLVGVVEVSIIEEAMPRLLAFNSGQIDYLHVPYNLVERVLDGSGAPKAEYAARGVRWTRMLESAFTYTYFNMEDPVVGGYTNERVALRRAIAMSFDVNNEIRVLRQGHAIPATQLVPPGIIGHDPARNRRTVYDPAAAQALLDKFGYRRGPDGYRTRPDGSPLVLQLGSPPDSDSREFDELWKRSMDAVGLRMEFVKQKWTELLKLSTAGKLQMFRLARVSTLRDGGGLLEILYGRNIGAGLNDSRFALSEYDRLFDKARVLPHGPERDALYAQLGDLAAAYMPIMLGTYRYRSVLSQPWVLGLRPDFFFREPWKFVDVDVAARREPGAAPVASQQGRQN
jgi:ABC-type transport system substrate-binding protein